MMKPAYTYRAKISRVIDGDTIVVDMDLGLGVWVHDQYLRLQGIDTPELRGDEREDGLKAKQFVRHHLAIATDMVIQTHKGDSKGKYGRWLATVWLNIDGEWVNLNHALVTSNNAVTAQY